ncbi:MAG: prolyl-tRNA synthetase associated domain-containing protein [Pseudomonadota bacterium]
MPETPEALFERFETLGIKTTTADHQPAFTVADAQTLRGQIPGGHCKNLFLKDKKGVYWLVVALEDTPVDLKSLPARIGSARLSFGSADRLMEVLGVTPGSVTPFALINDTDKRVNVILDADMLEHDLLNYHPLRNDQTTTIARADLLRFIEDCGHTPRTVALTDAI